MSLRTLTSRNNEPEDFWTISGNVTDANTGNPLSRFQVWSGDESFPGFLRFDERRPIEGAHGVYTMRVNKLVSMPVLKIAAPHYLPKAVSLPQDDRSNFDITLQPGEGPSGRVLRTNGQPAAFTTVALLHSGHVKILEDGKLHSGKNVIAMTDDAGCFSLAPELNMEWIVASGPEGFVMVSIEEFSTKSDLALQPWGRIKGILKWPSGAGSGEELHLIPQRPKSNSRWELSVANHAKTDSEGRFEFPRVPPGQYQLSYRVMIDERRFRMAPLAPLFTLSPGQTLELPIDAEPRKAPEIFFIRQPEPPVRSGPAFKGYVLLPDGQPAVGAEVGLVVQNESLPLLRGALGAARDPAFKTSTDASGHFELQGVQGVKAVVAVDRAGFAKVSPVPIGQPVTLSLQAWGRISGTLRIGNRLGANEKVSLVQSGSFKEQRMLHYTHAYEARTDSQGRFILTIVPPGEHCLARLIPTEENAWQFGIPTVIDVKPGETTIVTLGGTGRQVVGKIIPKTGVSPVDWSGVKVSLFTFQYGPPKELRTQAERQAWDESPEGRIAVNKRRHYEARLGGDGAFAFEEVDPEQYTLSVRRTRRLQKDHGMEIHEMMLGSAQITVPATATDGNATPYDVGTVESNLSLQFPPRPQ